MFVRVNIIFEYRERLEKVPNIRQNIHESIYDILYNMDKIVPPVELKNEESKISAQYIFNIGSQEPAEYTDVSKILPLTTVIQIKNLLGILRPCTNPVGR